MSKICAEEGKKGFEIRRIILRYRLMFVSHFSLIIFLKIFQGCYPLTLQIVDEQNSKCQKHFKDLKILQMFIFTILIFSVSIFEIS
jgi:hypothetical protein